MSSSHLFAFAHSLKTTAAKLGHSQVKRAAAAPENNTRGQITEWVSLI